MPDKNIIKCLLIDSKNQSIREVELEEGNINDIYNHIGCRVFETGACLNNNDVIYVDEEGLYSPANIEHDGSEYRHAFQLKSHCITLIGNGLVIGTNVENGDSLSCLSTFDEINRNVRFGLIKNS